MMNYRIWKCDDKDYLLVEVWDDCDIPSVQKEFIEKGYIVIETKLNIFKNHFIKFMALNLDGIDGE